MEIFGGLKYPKFLLFAPKSILIAKIDYSEYRVCVCVCACVCVCVCVYTVSNKSEYTPYIFVDILLYLFM